MYARRVGRRRGGVLYAFIDAVPAQRDCTICRDWPDEALRDGPNAHTVPCRVLPISSGWDMRHSLARKRSGRGEGRRDVPIQWERSGAKPHLAMVDISIGQSEDAARYPEYVSARNNNG